MYKIDIEQERDVWDLIKSRATIPRHCGITSTLLMGCVRRLGELNIVRELIQQYSISQDYLKQSLIYDSVYQYIIVDTHSQLKSTQHLLEDIISTDECLELIHPQLLPVVFNHHKCELSIGNPKDVTKNDYIRIRTKQQLDQWKGSFNFGNIYHISVDTIAHNLIPSGGLVSTSNMVVQEYIDYITCHRPVLYTSLPFIHICTLPDIPTLLG